MPASGIGKPSYYYSIVYWFSFIFYRTYYRSFSVAGRENIPAGKPVIFAGTHQNALMDALSVLYASHKMVVFLARADLFRRKWIASILYFLRLMPVYRMRDGISSMGQNELTFAEAVRVLKLGTRLALFPEGNHDAYKRLRPLKKGICRIAFMAEEMSGFSLDLHIVPTGIDYSNYSDPGTHLLVVYGKPIRVADYLDLYRENPQKALSSLRDDLYAAMLPLMIHIPDEVNYETIRMACELYRSEILARRNLRNSQYNRLRADQEIIATLGDQSDPDPLFTRFRNESGAYAESLTKYNLKDWLFLKGKSSLPAFLLESLLTLLLLPLHLYGLILNYLPYKVPTLVTRNIKDHVFDSSIHFGIGLLLFPIYHLVLLVIFSFIAKGVVIKILFALSLPISALFSFYYYKHLVKLKGKFRFLRLRLTDPKTFNDLVQQRKQLLNQIAGFIKAS